MALTDTEKQVWWNDSQHKDYTLKFAGLDDIGNSKIDSESMVFEDVLCGDEDIVFGRCCSAKFEIQLADVENNIKGNEFSVSVACDGVISQLGVFVVTDVQKTSNRRFKKVTAYDRMHYLEENVAEWYKYILPDMSTEVTLKTFRDSFFEYMDLPQEEITLINDDLIVRKTVDTNKITGIEIMQAVCEINGVFGHFDKTGVFCYVSISDEVESLPQYISSDYQEYETQGINRLQIRQESGDIGYATDVIEGVFENDYIITGNFLMYGMEPEELKLYGDRLIDKIKGITYKPAQTNYIGLPYLEIGKRYSVESKYDKFSSVIMAHTLSGGQSLRSVISATGNQYRNEAIEGLNYQFEQLRGKTNVLVRNVNETINKLTDLQNNTESQFRQTADAINSKVTKGSVSSEISQEAEQITIKGDRLVIEATNFKLRKDGVVEVSDGYIGGIKIGAEGLSSEDYETLKILKDGTGKFTNLTGEGQGHIDLTSHHTTDEEKDAECFFRTEDGFHADYDTEHNVSAGMYVNSEGNVTFSRVSGKRESREETGEVNLVLTEDGAKLLDKAGNTLPMDASNIPKAGFSKIRFENATFDSRTTTDERFNNYVRDINHSYSFFKNVQTHAKSNGYPYIYVSCEYESSIRFFALKTTYPSVMLGTNNGVPHITFREGFINHVSPVAGLIIDYNLDNNSITSQNVTFYWGVNSQVQLQGASNFSLFIPSEVVTFEIQILTINYGSTAAYDYVYQASDNLLRVGNATGEVIAEIAPNKIEEGTISAMTTEDDFVIKAGDGVDIIATSSTKEIAISAKIPEATDSTAGLITPSEKVKLKNIEQGAEVNVQADWNVTDTESDAYIHNKPVALSAFNNDKNFIDNTVSNLVNYYTKSNTYSKDEVNTLIGNIVTFDILVVSELPTENISTHIIYFVPKTTAEEQNVYDEYVNINGTVDGWEHLGDTKVDLSNYYTIQQIDNLLANKLGINDNAVSASYLKYKGIINSTTNWDDLTCGIYLVNAGSGFSSAYNAPIYNGTAAYAWGIAIVEGDIWQLVNHQVYYSHQNEIYHRSRWGGSSYKSWVKSYTTSYHPSADKLSTARKVGKASFDGSKDIALSDIMGQGTIPTSTGGHAGQYVKFATVDISSKAWDYCAGTFNVVGTESYTLFGQMYFHFRCGSTTETMSVGLHWASLTNSDYADSIVAVKSSGGLYDLYFKPVYNYETYRFTLIDCVNPEKVTLHSGQSYVESVEVAYTSQLVSRATSATKATQDGNGNVIVDTYATKKALETTDTNVTNAQNTANSALSKASPVYNLAAEYPTTTYYEIAKSDYVYTSVQGHGFIRIYGVLGGWGKDKGNVDVTILTRDAPRAIVSIKDSTVNTNRANILGYYDSDGYVHVYLKMNSWPKATIYVECNQATLVKTSSTTAPPGTKFFDLSEVNSEEMTKIKAVEEKLADYLPVKGGNITDEDGSIAFSGKGIVGDGESRVDGFRYIKSENGEFTNLTIEDPDKLVDKDGKKYSDFVCTQTYMASVPALAQQCNAGEVITLQTVFYGLLDLDGTAEQVIVEKTLENNLVDYAGAEIVYKYESSDEYEIYNTQKIYFTSSTFASTNRRWVHLATGDGSHIALIFQKTTNEKTVKISYLVRGGGGGLAKIVFFKGSENSHIM